MQDTLTLDLPQSKKQVIIKGYVSGLVDTEVQKVLATMYTTNVEMDAALADKAQPGEIPEGAKVNVVTDATAQLRADQKLLELMLLSVDGDNGAGLLDKLLALPKADVNFVMAKVKELQSEGEVVASDPKAPQS